MKKRIKNTPIWVEVIGNAGTVERPTILGITSDNSQSMQIFDESELTDLTLKQSAEKFFGEIFGKGNYLTKIKFYLCVLVAGIIIASLIF